MRHILSFKTSFPDSSDFDHPKGYSICEYMQKELARVGFRVGQVENYRDIAWSVGCSINSKKLFFFVGYLGTKVTDWQLIICSSIGAIGRVLGQKDEDERLQLAETIHEMLTQDDRFCDLKWFSKYTDTTKDVWYEQPEGVRH